MPTLGYLTMSGGWAVETWFWASAIPASTTWGFYLFNQDQREATDERKRQFLLGIQQDAAGDEDHPGALMVRIRDKNGTDKIDWKGEQDVCDSNWHHAAVTMAPDRRTCSVFLDGEKVVEVVSTSTIAWTGGGVACFGGAIQEKPFVNAGCFTGRLAYPAFKNAWVPDGRIEEHFRAGTGGRVFYDEDEVTRMNRILDWSEVPREARALDDDVTRLMGFEAQGANALTALQDQAEDAGGYVYADGQGKVRYHNRRRRYNRFPVVIMEEDTGLEIEADFQLEADNAWIYNDIRGNRPYGPSFRITNQKSREEYSRRIYKIELNITSNDELRDAMTWFMGKYEDQHVRVPKCSILVTGDEDPLWKYATCGYLDLGDKIVLGDLPDNAPSSSMEFFIEGISVEADVDSDPPKWRTEYTLSPGEQEYVWELDSSEWWGALDEGAPLGY